MSEKYKFNSIQRKSIFETKTEYYEKRIKTIKYNLRLILFTIILETVNF